MGRLISSLFYGSMFLGAGLSAAIGVLIWLLRRKEERDVAEDLDPNHRAVATLMEAENTPGYVQNHLTAVTRLKPGWFRRLTLATAFWGIEKLVQHRFRPGFVLDIGSIHFARWLRLPGTNTLVFFSNYDGSWESYLEDFITKAHLGQTSVWSNGIGFPRTRYLMLDGAKDGNRFKRWVRRQQVSTSFWYSRFPTLTTDQIRNNALICHGLANARTDSDARAWLELFNSQPRPTEALEMHEIQSLAFGGMGKLPVAELIALRFPASLDRCATWIRDIMSLNGDGVADGGRAEPAAVPLTAAYEPSFGVAPRVSFGDVMPDDRAMIVALSASGLRRLGLDRMGLDEHGNALSSFPAAFVEGMAGPIRSRILADEGDSAPDKWQWGSPHSMPDAVLLLYAGTHGQLVEARARELMSLRKHGLEVLSTIPLEVGKGQVEPFGFRDGVSQPIIRGTRRFNLGANPIHVVEPGEFVLGYPDNRGKYPPTPVIAAGHDTDCCLPSTPERLPGRFPAFAATQVDMSRDFGRNGSFLVIRQLEQDVPGFQAFLKQAAADLQSRYRGLRIDEDWVASKMIGRWRNGSSLARHPHSAGTEADNDFWLGVDDPQGLRCPYGAHVRRANPRDSFHPGSREQLEISNRHRLLRVGRPYGEVADEPEANSPRFKAKGLMFMCLNADIERQFEFVQQTWVSSRSFHGLTNEVDPVAGSCPGGGMFTIPTPAGPIELKVPQSFVTVRGGGYFFLPSRSALRFLCSVGA